MREKALVGWIDLAQVHGCSALFLFLFIFSFPFILNSFDSKF
jgi:hypothetical protein